MPPSKKIRLDVRVAKTPGVESLQRAQALIMAGKVKVDGLVQTTAGFLTVPGQQVIVDRERAFVSRGAQKLLTALEIFPVEVKGRNCVDVGSSTGGFTDVLLRNGAARVFCIDSARGELDWGLRNDDRVEVMEGAPVQRVKDLPEAISLAVCDVSLISLRVVLPCIYRWMQQGDIIALFKPQYELAADRLPPGAVLRDPKLHAEVLQEVLPELENESFRLCGIVPSRIKGGSGNQEFLIWLSDAERPQESLTELITSALASQQV